MAIEKMSVEEIGERVHEVGVVLCMVLENIKVEALGENLAQEELNAIIVGAIAAINYLHGTYLGGFDEIEPDTVPIMRVLPGDRTASVILETAVSAYKRFFIEEGDEQ